MIHRSAADLPEKKAKQADTIPIVIDGVVYEKTVKDAVNIAMTILTLASERFNG